MEKFFNSLTRPWFFVIFLTPNHFMAQTISPVAISGQVKDTATGNALPNANVFLANTTLGAVTDAHGRFSITRVNLGTHEIWVSLLGYEIHKQPLRVIEAKDLQINFSLKAKAVEMGGIDVVAEAPREWKKNLKNFEELFWGNSYDDEECKILNPEILDFTADQETDCFIAKAPQPLQIANRRLGYRAQFYLQEFRYYLSDKEIKYAFTPKFDELMPADEKEKKKWRDNRLKAYYGSFRHFLTAMVAGGLPEEGYVVASLPGLPWDYQYNRYVRRPVDFANYLSASLLPTEVELNFQGCLEITYTSPNGVTQKSWMVTNREHILLNKNGYAYDGYAFVLYGHWFLQRVADMLPRDYVPE